MSDDVDVIVLGMGVGGEEVGGRLAEAGLDVVGIEGRLVGGECPYWACIPSKMTIRAANLLAETGRVNDMAGRAHAIPDYTPVARRIRQEATTNWDDTTAAERFIAKGGRLVRGWGRLDGPGRVVVGDDIYQARRAIVVASGTAPAAPPIPGLAGTPYWTNRELLECSELPDSLLVLGGGPVGIELAQAWARLGVAVTVVEASDRIMGSEEPESARVVAETLKAEGVQVHTNARVTEVKYSHGFTLSTEDRRNLEAERLLVSVGRKTGLDGLGIDTIGLDPSASALSVDGQLRAAEHVWAVGDVTSHGGFTHMAIYQADIIVNDILGHPRSDANYTAVPRVTFTDPEVGAVGLTENAAREAGINVTCGQADIASTARGWIHGPGNSGLVKLVADADRGVLVGGTTVGPAGGEMLGFLAVAVRGGVDLSVLRDMPYAYPTFYRGIETALGELDV